MERHEVEVKMQFSHQTLADLLTTAIEGGSNYWASFRGVERDSDLNVTKVTVIDEGGDEARSFVMSPSLMLVGIQRLADRMAMRKVAEAWHFKPKSAARILGEVITQDGDATTADVVLQMALFNEVLYG